MDLPPLDAAPGLDRREGFLAVAIVAHAVWGMARSLTPDGPHAAIAVPAFVIVTGVGGMAGQVAAILAGALAGDVAEPRRGSGSAALGQGRRSPHGQHGGAGVVLQPAAGGRTYPECARVAGDGDLRRLLPRGGTRIRRRPHGPAAVAGRNGRYRLGGERPVPGRLWACLSRIGAYLGAGAGTGTAVVATAAAAGRAIVALVAIFLPGLLLVYAALPFWRRFSSWPKAQHAVCGTNAAVVGLLGAALYDPVWTGAVLDARDGAVAVAGF